MAQPAVKHVFIFVQENHTVDNYFRVLAAYGGNVATGWPTSPNPPGADQPHNRAAYFKWLSGTVTRSQHVQVDTAAVLPFYAYLALTGTFFENHCAGFGTNSTPNHMLLLGGQSTTLRNPPQGTHPTWDLPSLPGLCEENQVAWKCYTGADKYPTQFYQQIAGSPNIVPDAQFATDAASGKLPTLAMMWHDSPADEHPPADVTVGHNAIWQAVDAVVKAGLWQDSLFMLTYDDWGGFDDHVRTPVVEYTPDNVQLAYGPRVPLIMFGGCVKPGIDSRWCSHVSVPKTAMQLLGLPNLGVPRLDDDPGLADRVDPALKNPPPPAFGATISLPKPPLPTPKPNPTPPPPSAAPVPVPPVVLRGGKTLPQPNDQPLPKQPQPPTNH